jgi:hypothetical protein
VRATLDRRAQRALLLVASLTALAAAAPAAPAAAAGGVRILINGGTGPRVPLEELANNRDVSAEMWSLVEGRSPTRTPHSGTSTKLLLALAGLDAGTVSELSIQQPLGSGSVTLRGAEITDGFSEGPAVFDAGYNASEVHFFRPQRTTSDINSRDAVDPPTGRDLVVAATTVGGVLGVHARADPTQVDAGAPVSFSATVDGAPAGVTYTWDFGDGTDARSASDSLTHVFAGGGSYTAIVTAYTHGGASGADVVHVQVGAPPGAPGGTSGGGGTTAQTGGGHGGRRAASTGRASGGVRGGVRGTGGRGVARGGDDASVHDESASAQRRSAAQPAAHPAAPASSPPPARATAPARPRPVSAAHTTRSRSAHAGRHGREAVRSGRRRSAARADRAARTQVSGVLLASSGNSASALTGLRSAEDASQRDAVARSAATDSSSLTGWLLGGLALAALLGLGAAREAGVRVRVRRGASAS